MRIRKVKILIALLLNLSPIYCQSINWVNQIKSYNYEKLQGLLVTSQGESFITGYIDGSSSTSFGNLIVPSIDLPKNYFIAKCDQSGNFVWVKTGGGWSYNIGNSVESDNKGNIYTTGVCMGDARFDNILLPQQQYPGQTFLAKYDEAGDIQWVKRYCNYGNDYEGGGSLRYLNGYLYNFTTTATGTGVAIFDTTINASGSIIYMTKFDTLGNFVHTKKLAVSLAGLNLRGVVPEGNDFVLTGFTNYYNILVDTVQIQVPFPKHQSFIAKFNSNLDLIWAKKFSSTNYESFVTSIDIDDDKNILAAGVYYDTLTVDGKTLINSSSVDAKSFICKLDLSGNLLWIKDINGDGYLASIGISHFNDRIYSLGYFAGYLNTEAVHLVSPYAMNLSILEFDSNGNTINGISLGSKDKYIQSNNLGIDSKGSLYITGQYLDHTRLLNNMLYADSLYSGTMEDWANTTDGLIFKFQPETPNWIPENGFNKNEINLYPNPNDGKFTVHLASQPSKGIIEVFNILGNLVYNKEINFQTEIVELSNVSPGTYLLRIRDSNQELAKIFFVQK